MFTGSLDMFSPMVGLEWSAMDCMAIPQSIPVNPESVESNHWMFCIWFRPVRSSSTMLSTTSLADSLFWSAPSLIAFSSPMPAEIPTPPMPARPQLFRMAEKYSASIPYPVR